MSAFFVHTDHSIAGPFTGIELREAALAGIIRFDAVIGGGPNGPWFKAADVGLFNTEKRIPLPHPEGTVVPIYELRGMPGPFQGPFKLRELIGFAARGLLPVDAMLKSDQSQEWISVQRIGVLMACLNGELVLVDESGNVVVRTNILAAQESERDALRRREAKAPIEVVKPLETARKPISQIRTKEELAEVEREVAAERAIAEEAAKAHEAERKANVADRGNQDKHVGRSNWAASLFTSIRSLANPRLAARLAGILILFAGVASAFSYWSHIRMDRSEVIGNWGRSVLVDGYPKLAFAISFHEDGQLILFNATGNCWTGAFEWSEPLEDQKGFDHSFSTTIDEVSEAHRQGLVAVSDGYVTFSGFLKDAPQIEGHEVRDFFVRRSGKSLLVGYPTAVHWSPSGRTMEAGWIKLDPISDRRGDLYAELREIKQEGPPNTDDYGGESPVHLSGAIDRIETGTPAQGGNQVTLHQTMVYANGFDSGALVAKFGMPDEARVVYEFEKPEIERGPSLEGAQAIRYGNLQFLASPGGKLRYLTQIKAGY